MRREILPGATTAAATGQCRWSPAALLMVALATLNLPASSLSISSLSESQQPGHYTRKNTAGMSDSTGTARRQHRVLLFDERTKISPQRFVNSRPGRMSNRVLTVRGGAESGKKDEKGDVSGEAEPAPGSERGDNSLAAKTKALYHSFLGVLKKLLGDKGEMGGGSRGGSGRSRTKTSKGKHKSKKKKKRAKGNAGDSGAGGFTQAFEAKYGKSHPAFNEKSFSDATEYAWTRNRLCLVYIAAEGGGGKAAKIDSTICKTLADPKVAEFVDSNFVMWVPGGTTSSQRAAAASSAAKRVGARSLPFVGVVNSASSTNKMTSERKLSQSTVALHHCNPPPSPEEMVSWMTRVLELKKGLLETELAEQQRLKDEDTIHTERVEGYSKSLKDDALREVREKDEEAERARLEEEQKRAEEAKLAKEQEDIERRERKAVELGHEPPESSAGGEENTVSTLMLRLADGSRIRRRFVRADTMGKVFDWADVQGVDLESQKLSSSFPKASFAYPEDSSMTIEHSGLGKQALLSVEQKPKKALSSSGTGEGTDDATDGDAAAGVEGEL